VYVDSTAVNSAHCANWKVRGQPACVHHIANTISNRSASHQLSLSF